MHFLCYSKIVGLVDGFLVDVSLGASVGEIEGIIVDWVGAIVEWLAGNAVGGIVVFVGLFVGCWCHRWWNSGFNSKCIWRRFCCNCKVNSADIEGVAVGIIVGVWVGVIIGVLVGFIVSAFVEHLVGREGAIVG